MRSFKEARGFAIPFLWWYYLDNAGFHAVLVNLLNVMFEAPKLAHSLSIARIRSLLSYWNAISLLRSRLTGLKTGILPSP